MANKIPDRKTTITLPQFLSALAHAWVNLFEKPATKNQLLVLAAQSALETGRWKYAHNYNLGNVKSNDGDGRDYTFFACNEILDPAVAAAYQAKSTPDRPAKVTGQVNGKSEIWFYPEHPGCRFRAYAVLDADGNVDEEASLYAGMVDYLGLLYTRFSRAWPAVLAGDPVEFVKALKSQGYFTAPLEPYVRSVSSIFNEFSKVEFDYDSLPVLSDHQKAQLSSFVTLTLQESIRSSLAEDLKKRDEEADLVLLRSFLVDKYLSLLYITSRSSSSRSE